MGVVIPSGANGVPGQLAGWGRKHLLRAPFQGMNSKAAIA
jgi:hypothetical protein